MNRKFFLVRLATTLGIAALSTSAVMAESSPETSETSAKAAISAAPAGKHCVAELAPVSGRSGESATVAENCYKTFAAAMAAATDNTVMLAPSATPESVTEKVVALAATRVIGIDYDRTYYSGASYTWYVRNSYGCNGGFFYASNMPNSFNNRLTSTKGFSGCRNNTSFDLKNLRGDWVRCVPNCLYVGSFMDNRASSKRWSWR